MVGPLDSRRPPVWFLDVDGVLSPYGRGQPWDGATLLSGPMDSDLAVPYRFEVIERIQRLHLRGAVEVRWLTTWDAEALGDWARVGLGPFPKASPHVRGRRRWWKADLVHQWLSEEPKRRVIWTDDDITPARRRGMDKARLLAIAPEHTVGLTDEHLAQIEQWIRESDESCHA